MNILGARIKYLRKRSNLTQGQLAKKMNLTQASISGYETGDRQPDNEILTRIADFFNVSIDYLLGRTSNPNNDKVSVHFFERDNLTDEDLEYIDTIVEALKTKTNQKNQ
ncbi:TPA: helix-turn-helix domain-containing protein [Listeria monocytogenes]